MSRSFTFLFLAVGFFFPMATYGQVPASTLARVKDLYNRQQAEALYNLTDTTFQKLISRPAFAQALQTQLFPFGKMTTLEYAGETSGISRYKCLLDKGAVLQLVIGVNKSGQLTTLIFQPWQEPAPLHSEAQWHDNALATATDSMVHEAATKYLKQTRAPGLAMAVLQGTKARFYHYGLARPRTSQHPTASMNYEIGSITKTFTAFLLADAVVNKNASLSDPITQYLPDSVGVNASLKNITLLHLANHTSGLPRLPDNFPKNTNPADPYASYSDALLFAYLKNAKPANTPGTQYTYSNLGFGLLGVMLERIYGLPLESLYKDKIFTPFRMPSTFGTPIADTSMAALPFTELGYPAAYWKFQSMAGAGSLKSCTIDLVRYAMQFTLKPRTRGQTDARVSMLEQITHRISDSSLVSLGWHFNKTEGSDRIMDHSGGTGGFRSYLGICAGRQLAVVVLVNAAASPGADALGKPLLAKMLATD